LGKRFDHFSNTTRFVPLNVVSEAAHEQVKNGIMFDACMHAICMEKFRAHPHLNHLLFPTGNAILVEVWTFFFFFFVCGGFESWQSKIPVFSAT